MSYLQHMWLGHDAEDRLSLFKQSFAEFELSDSSIQRLNNYAELYETQHMIRHYLPGPTGETNIVRSKGRGHAVIIYPAQEAELGFIQILVGLLTGNALFVNTEHTTNFNLDKLKELLMIINVTNALNFISADEAEVLTYHHSTALISVIANKAEIIQSAQRIANHHPMIPQFLYEIPDEPRYFMDKENYMSFWIHEKTRTENTTAVGGNPELIHLAH